MKVLIACEESQVVCKAFRECGYEVYFCGIQKPGGNHPEWHILGDAVIEAYSGKYRLMIAHPPCTYLSNVGARWLKSNGILNQERYKLGCEAKDLFMSLYNAPIPYICIENPTPTKVYNLPKHSQVIHPYQFGHKSTKRTLLWLKGLPLLKPTNVLRRSDYLVCKGGKIVVDWTVEQVHGRNRSKSRSKTFPGIAKAMTEQWGTFIA